MSRALLTISVLLCLACHTRMPRTTGPLAHEAFVWQRAWTADLADAVLHRDARLRQLDVLAAEITWRGDEPVVASVRFDADALRRADAVIALAMRVEVPRTWRTDGGAVLARTAGQVLATARAGGLRVDELQVDLDAPESKLAEYREWLRAVRGAIRPARLVITALPAWLDDRRGFSALIAETDGFVLQVHSLTLPKHAGQTVPLCDPAAARGWVEQAARFGIPFRVALPTYGYRAVFDRGGALLGLVADGSSLPVEAAFARDEVRADAAEMAGLVAGWTEDRPAALAGIAWYRLPVEHEALNWSRAALSAVMDGRAPQPRLVVSVTESAPTLLDVAVTNGGEGDGAVKRLRLDIAPEDVVAADGLGACTYEKPRGFTCRGVVVRAGRTVAIGWIRLRRPADRNVVAVVAD